MEQQSLSLEPLSVLQSFLNSEDLRFQLPDKTSGRFPAKSSLGSQCRPFASEHQSCVLTYGVPRSGFHQVRKIIEPFIWKAVLKKKKNVNYLLWLSHSLLMITV